MFRLDREQSVMRQSTESMPVSLNRDAHSALAGELEGEMANISFPSPSRCSENWPQCLAKMRLSYAFNGTAFAAGPAMNPREAPYMR